MAQRPDEPGEPGLWSDSATARPRPQPLTDPFDGFPAIDTAPVTPIAPAATPPAADARRSSRRFRRGRNAPAVRVDQQAGQAVAAAGNAVVTAARVGRLLTRTGWRLAKQLPGADVVEAQAQRLRDAAAHEVLRMLELPQNLFGTATADEQAAMLLVHNGSGDPEPLRSAMTELLQRSSDPDRAKSRDYLFGTIVSQLVPDEARILATLSEHGPFAVIDVVAKQIGRSATRTVLANVSMVGFAAAAIVSPNETATHLSRLHGLGLVEMSQADAESPELASQFDTLEQDDTVRTAKAEIDSRKLGNARLVRKTVQLSQLGWDFWTACAPNASALERDRR